MDVRNGSEGKLKWTDPVLRLITGSAKSALGACTFGTSPTAGNCHAGNNAGFGGCIATGNSASGNCNEGSGAGHCSHGTKPTPLESIRDTF